MEFTKSDYVRISLSSDNACNIKLTGISDPDAIYDSSDNRMWIEVPIERKHLLISMSFSRDVFFNVFLGARSANEEDSPSVKYKRLLLNRENILGSETVVGKTPIIVKHKARKDEYMHMIVEWDVLDVTIENQLSASVYAPITAETIANMHTSASFESEQDRKLRLDKWNALNSSLEKKQSLLQPLEYIVIDSKKLVYIVNSKVANTSIKFSLSEDYYDDDYSIHPALVNRDISVSELTETQRDYFTFTFVRNPFSRLVSCYVSKYHTDIQIYKKRESDFTHYLDGYMENDEGFGKFIEKVYEIPYRLMDRHFRLQRDIVFDENGECRCNYIGKIEHLKKYFEPIRKAFGLRRLPHYNMTNMGNWMDFYTEESAKKVYDKYRQDFESFGYSHEYDKLMNYIKTK